VNPQEDNDEKALTEAYDSHLKEGLDLNQSPTEPEPTEAHPETQYSQLVDENSTGVIDAEVGGDAGADAPPEETPDEDSVGARVEESEDLGITVEDQDDLKDDLTSDLDRQFAEADRLADVARKAREDATIAEENARKAREHLEDEIGGYRPRCPHDQTRLVRHEGDDPIKAKSWHCNTCGCCWAPGIRHIRVGTPICNKAPVMDDGTVVAQRP
jgi:hypothetical protein